MKCFLRLLPFYLALPILIAGCGSSHPKATVNIKLYQSWELKIGDRVSGYEVTGGLGDISIALNGGSVYAPFTGETAMDQRGCLYFETPEVPAYKFRFCGVMNPKIGTVQIGDVIAKAGILQFAALRKQPNGTWAIVEPAKSLLEKTLKAP